MPDFSRERAIAWGLGGAVVTFFLYLYLLLRPVDLSFVERLAVENCEEIERIKATRLEGPLRNCREELPVVRRRVPLPGVD